MTGWRSASAGALLVAVVGTTAPASADPGPSYRRLFAFRDARIAESSGLVDRGRVVLTINDSGDGPYVYAVDSRSGSTVAVTTYSPDGVEDVEALAPGRGRQVWVGDIGDNRAARDTVSVYAVRPSYDGDRTVAGRRFDLAYPDGPRDAETLLVQPRTGRVFVVSKSVFGGTVYRAPRRLSAAHVNRLQPFAKVDGLITDGTFLPDGKHVLLRTYGGAEVYAFPDFAPVGPVRLPEQRQGEAISSGPHGRVLVSSEGVHSPVWQVSVPERLLGAQPRAQAPASPQPTRAPTRPGLDPPASTGEWWRAGAAALALLAAGWGVTRLSRVRKPRG